MKELSLLTKQKKLPLATLAMRNEKDLPSFILGNKSAFHNNVVKKTVDGMKSSSLFCQRITETPTLKPWQKCVTKTWNWKEQLEVKIGEGAKGRKV